jgi:hypothetical protein
MYLNRDFWNEAEPLKMPAMGTELMAPFLYSLIRSMKPRSVVEAGMGYTSLFIAQALADNLDDFNKESDLLEVKLQAWETRRKLASDQESLNQVHAQCLTADPPLASPGYYRSDYRPLFHVIDTMTDQQSSAPRVMGALERLNLLHVVRFHDCGFREFLDHIEETWLPFDLMWNDADGGGGVGFGELFELVNPNGGMIILHDTLTSESGLKQVRAAKQLQKTNTCGEFELFNLLEPHKLIQASATIIRRTSGNESKPFAHSMTPEIEDDVRKYLEIRDRQYRHSLS